MRRFLLYLIFLLLTHSSMGQASKVTHLIKRENFKAAEEYGLEKLETLEKKDRAARLPLMLAMGRLYEALGDLPEAQKYLNSALEYVQVKYDSGDRLTLSDYDVIDEFALYSIRAGNFLEAEKWIEFSLANRVGKYFKNNPTNFRPYLAKGLLFYQRNQPDSAKYYIEEYLFNIRNSNYTGHLEINRYADGFQILSEMALDAGNLEEAKKYARNAKRLQKHSWTKREEGKNTVKRVRAMNTLSEVLYLMGRVQRAQEWNDRAFKLYLKNIRVDLPVLNEVLVQRSHLHLFHEDIEGIKGLIRQAAEKEINYISRNFSLLSEYEKENFQVRHRKLFNKMNKVMIEAWSRDLIGNNDPFWVEVLDYNTRTKGLILNESTRLYQKEELFADSLHSQYEAWKFLKNQFAFMVSSKKYKNEFEAIQNIESEIIKLERVLLTALPVSSVDSLDIEDILKDLKPRDKIIELLRVDTSSPTKNRSGEWKKQEDAVYLVFHLDNGGFNNISLVENGLELENRYINYYNNSIKYRLTDTLSYDAFWKSLNVEEENWGKIYFSPDGIYNLMNPDNLWDTENEKYLFEKINLINLTSIRRLNEVKTTGNPLELKACLVGNPDFDHYEGIKPEPLPETAIEVTEIEVMLNRNEGNSRVLMGLSASENELKKLSGCPILHVATHGIFRQNAGSRNAMLNSGLLLAGNPEEGEDGILTAYEAAGLNLRDTRIAVLSACDTGLGEIQSGEGVYGLQRAFEVNGVDFTLMSMWKVDDSATREFMSEFYSQLVEQKLDPYASLKETRNKMKDKYQETYYWGAFKLVGASWE